MKTEFLMNHKGWIIGSIVGIILIIAIVFAVLNALKSVTVSILVAPHDASVYINGARYNNGDYKVFPANNAEVKINAPGFEEKTYHMNFEANTTAVIQDYLINTENGLNYYKKNSDDYEILKLVAKDDEASAFIKKTEAALNVRESLPLAKYSRLSGEMSGDVVKLSDITEIYDATNNEQCDEIICLEISTNTGGTDMAKTLLEENGFDIADYKLIITEHTEL